MPSRRRFPPQWTIEEFNDACFVVRDHDGQQLAYVYFEDESGEEIAAKLLTRHEARRIAVNIATLPELLSRHRVECDETRRIAAACHTKCKAYLYLLTATCCGTHFILCITDG